MASLLITAISCTSSILVDDLLFLKKSFASWKYTISAKCRGLLLFFNFANIDNQKIYEDAFCAVIKLVRYKHDGDLPKLRKGQHLEQLITYDWGYMFLKK